MLDKRLVLIAPETLYWINTTSAFLDNATLTAAEFSPNLPISTLKYMLISLLISGGILIPGNIPNIVCANKLSLKVRNGQKLACPWDLVY